MKVILLGRKTLLKSVLIVALVVSSIIGSRPYVKSVFQNENRKLPIYSVDTQEKKVAISFDAAWGEAS